MLGALEGEPAERFDLEAKYNLRTARDGGVNRGTTYSTYTGNVPTPEEQDENPYNFNFNFNR